MNKQPRHVAYPVAVRGPIPGAGSLVPHAVPVLGETGQTSDTPQEYLAAGVRQYWLIDPLTRTATIHIRRGDTWRKTKLDRCGKITTALLPAFELRLSDIFAVLR